MPIRDSTTSGDDDDDDGVSKVNSAPRRFGPETRPFVPNDSRVSPMPSKVEAAAGAGENCPQKKMVQLVPVTVGYDDGPHRQRSV